MEILVAGGIIVGVLLYAWLKVPKPMLVQPTRQEVQDEMVAAGEEEDVPTPEVVDFQSMTKVQIDQYAMDRGIKLDRRRAKARMIEDLMSQL